MLDLQTADFLRSYGTHPVVFEVPGKALLVGMEGLADRIAEAKSQALTLAGNILVGAAWISHSPTETEPVYSAGNITFVSGLGYNRLDEETVVAYIPNVMGTHSLQEVPIGYRNSPVTGVGLPTNTDWEVMQRNVERLHMLVCDDANSPVVINDVIAEDDDEEIRQIEALSWLVMPRESMSIALTAPINIATLPRRKPTVFLTHDRSWYEDDDG